MKPAASSSARWSMPWPSPGRMCASTSKPRAANALPASAVSTGIDHHVGVAVDEDDGRTAARLHLERVAGDEPAAHADHAGELRRPPRGGVEGDHASL